jgi:hypothetical protein
MEFVFAVIAALSLSSLPLILGWRRTASEEATARVLGAAARPRRFDPDRFALQTGTGLAFNQIAMGFGVWAGGSLFAGLSLGLPASLLFGMAGGLLYAGTLADRRQQFTLSQAKDVLRALGIVETLLSQGRTLFDSWTDAAGAVGPDGQVVLVDLVTRLRACVSGEEGSAVRAWAEAWSNPAVDIVATVLYSHYTLSIDAAPMIRSLRDTLSAIVEILSRARAAAKGIEWQAKFLAIFPPLVLVFVSLTTREAGQIYARNPLYLLPVLLGSAGSYWLSMRMVRNGLSIEASMGLQSEGMIAAEQMGAIDVAQGL